MERDLREDHRKATAEAGKLIADAHAKAASMLSKLEMELAFK